MSIKPQKLSEIRDFYDIRFRILSETIQKICFRIEEDELISILKEDSDSREFIFERIKEIFEEFVKEDRQIIMNKINEKFEEKSEKNREYKEIVDKLHKINQEQEEIIQQNKVQIKELTEKHVGLVELEEKMNGYEIEIDRLNKCNGSLEEKLREFEEKSKNFEQMKKEQQLKIIEFEKLNEENHEKNQSFQEKIRFLEDKNINLEEKILILVKNMEESQEKLRFSEERAENLLQDLGLKAKNNKDLELKINFYEEKLKNEVLPISEEKAKLNQKNEELLSELNSMKNEFKDLQEKLRFSTEKVTENIELKTNFKKKLALIDKITQSKKKYKAKVEELKKIIERSSDTHEIEVLRNENRRLESINREKEENLKSFQQEVGAKYQELVEFSNCETMKRAELEKKLTITHAKIKVFSSKIKAKLRELQLSSEEIQSFLDFRSFANILSKLQGKTLEIPMIKQTLLELNKKNEELSNKYLQKLEALEQNSSNSLEYQGKINNLMKRLKESTEALNNFEKKANNQEEEIKNLKKSQYNMRLLFEEKVYRLEKELGNKEKERAQTSRKEETLYQNLQKKYRYHNLLRKAEEDEKSKTVDNNNNNEENTTFGELRNYNNDNKMKNLSNNMTANINGKAHKRKLSLKEF